MAAGDPISGLITNGEVLRPPAGAAYALTSWRSDAAFFTNGTTRVDASGWEGDVLILTIAGYIETDGSQSSIFAYSGTEL